MKIYDSITNVFDWNKLDDIPEITKLKETPQNEIWHKEGNAFVHTCMVVQQALDHISNVTLDALKYEPTREILVYAALLHDVGKGVVTTKGEDGLYHASNHAVKSAEMAVNILKRLEVDKYLHQAIISLVRWHMQPMYILEAKNPKRAVLKLANNLEQVNMDLLLLLKQCDCEGSIYDTDDHREEILSKVRELYYDNVTYSEGTEVTLTKIGDNDTCTYPVGQHPNGINTGYQIRGKLHEPITIGHRVPIGSFRSGFSTSPVTEIVNKSCFKTKNSVYHITDEKCTINKKCDIETLNQTKEK